MRKYKYKMENMEKLNLRSDHKTLESFTFRGIIYEIELYGLTSSLWN